MRGLEKFILIVFSIVIIIAAIFLILVSTEMINAKNIFNAIETLLKTNKIVILVGGSIFSLLGLIGLFSTSENGEDSKSGLAIKGETGTVYITKDTFESIIVGVTRGYAELKNVKVDMLVTESGVIANIYTMILPETVVPTLTSKLQENVKASVLKQTTIEIKEVNIKIKGVYIDTQKK